jgi:hypothetical protein
MFYLEFGLIRRDCLKRRRDLPDRGSCGRPKISDIADGVIKRIFVNFSIVDY